MVTIEALGGTTVTLWNDAENIFIDIKEDGKYKAVLVRLTKTQYEAMKLVMEILSKDLD